VTLNEGDTMCILRTASIVALLLCGVQVYAQDAQVPSKAELLDRWERNWAGVSRLEVCFDRDWSLGEIRQGQVPYISYRFRCEPEVAVWWQSQWGEGNGVTASYECSTAESRMRSAQKSLWRSSLKNYARDGGTDWMLSMLRSPYPSSDSEYYLSMDLSGLLRNSNASIRPALENVEGRAAAVLDYVDPAEGGPGSMTVWLDVDVERNAVPLRWQSCPQASGGPLTQVDLYDFGEVDGAWFSTRMRMAFGGALAGDLSELRAYPCAGSDEPIQIQAMPAPPLTIQFYKHAPVVDEDTGGIYVAAKPKDAADAMGMMVAAGKEAKLPIEPRAATGMLTFGLAASFAAFGLGAAVAWPFGGGRGRGRGA
jgi:hypothetical protein